MDEIAEVKYQKIKTELNKEDDYFTKGELEKYGISFDVIYIKIKVFVRIYMQLFKKLKILIFQQKRDILRKN